MNNMFEHQMLNLVNVKLFLSFLLLLALAACQDNELTDLNVFVELAHRDQRPELQPLPAIQPYSEFTYTASKELDPFSVQNIVANRAEDTGVSGLAPDSNRHREALELFALEALTMVGTVVQDSRPWVLVKTPEGIVVRATIGNYMGQNDGQIKSIAPALQTVVLAELLADSSGHWVLSQTEMNMDE